MYLLSNLYFTGNLVMTLKSFTALENRKGQDQCSKDNNINSSFNCYFV